MRVKIQSRRRIASGARPAARHARASSAAEAATRAGIAGQFTFQMSAWRATTASSRAPLAATSIGSRPPGGTGRTRAPSSVTNRPLRVTDSPRQSARTASVSSSHATRSLAESSGRPHARSSGRSPIDAKKWWRPGAIRSALAATWARCAAFQCCTSRIDAIRIRCVRAISAVVAVQPSSTSASRRETWVTSPST